MNTSNTSSYDNLNSRIINEIPHIISLYLTHMINCMIRTEIYPKFLKVKKIIKILKPKKPTTLMSSYHPIAI